SIWEGSGNVAALDVLRALGKEPAALEAFLAEVETAAGADRRLDAAVAGVRKMLGAAAAPERAQLMARSLAERMALVLQGSLLVRYSHPALADAFCASRLDGEWGNAFGTLPAGADLTAVLEHVRPETARGDGA
ncbi:DNA alkylation response protein, partial [Streptomyces kronopolitis]